MKSRAVSLFLAFAISAVCAQAQNSAAQHAKTSQLQSVSKQVDALTAQVNELRSAFAELQAKLAAPDFPIAQARLAGTYAIAGIQNELDPNVPASSTNPGHPSSVGSYVYTGTVVLEANGAGSFTGSQTGSYLFVGQPSLASASQPPATVTFDWTYANGIVTLSSASDPKFDGQTFNVALGGQVMTHASANASDGTDVLIILTRVQ